MKEFREKEKGDNIKKRQLTYPKTSTPDHKENDSEEVQVGSDLDSDLGTTYTEVLGIECDVEILNSDAG